MWTYFSILASTWGQARSKLGGVDMSILHHAFISIFIALWAVITHYISILMAILSYFTRFTMKRGNVGSWDSGWKRCKYWKPILHSSKSPATPRKSFLDLIKIIERRNHKRGPTPWPGGWGRAPCLLGPLVALWCPSSAIWRLLPWKKNQRQAYGMKLRRHEAEPWRNQSRAPAELFYGETSLREEEIITIVITNDPLIGGGSISINIFTSTISSQNPSTSPVSNSCLQVQDWC